MRKSLVALTVMAMICSTETNPYPVMMFEVIKPPPKPRANKRNIYKKRGK